MGPFISFPFGARVRSKAPLYSHPGARHSDVYHVVAIRLGLVHVEHVDSTQGCAAPSTSLLSSAIAYTTLLGEEGWPVERASPLAAAFFFLFDFT